MNSELLGENVSTPRNEWENHLSPAGEEEYQQLASLLSDDPEAFTLFIIRSDFDTETRDSLLERLRNDLAPTPMVLVSMTREQFNLPVLIHEAIVQLKGGAFLAIVGLEETPNLVSAPGTKAARPPALALLNHGREAIRNVQRPVLIWCDPIAYSALREFAPDFFDHYTALFDFLDAAPYSSPDKLSALSTNLTSNGLIKINSAPLSPHRPISFEAVRFYEDQVIRFQDPSIDRIHALMGLSDALFAFDDTEFLKIKDHIEAILREALSLSKLLGLRIETARTQSLLFGVLNRIRRIDGNSSSESDAEILYHANQALKVFDEANFPNEWAATEWALGHYIESNANPESRIGAIAHLQAAQRVWTKKDAPYYWAAIETNIAQIYQELPITPRTIKRSISHLEKALEGYTEKAFPHEWALAQMLLSRSYSLAAEKLEKDNHSRARQIRRAIACSEAATHGFTKAREWQNAAISLASSGLLWSQLPTGNRRQHFRHSADSFLKSADMLSQTGDEKQQALYYEAAAEMFISLAGLTRNTAEVSESISAYESVSRIKEKIGDVEGVQLINEKIIQLRKFIWNIQNKVGEKS